MHTREKPESEKHGTSYRTDSQINHTTYRYGYASEY